MDGFDSIDVGPVKVDTGNAFLDIGAGLAFLIVLIVAAKWLRR